MSTSSDERDRGLTGAAGHFAEAQSEILEGMRTLFRGAGPLGELVAAISAFGTRREELLERATLERIRRVLLDERDALAEDDAVTRRAFESVVAVLDREIARLEGSRKAEPSEGRRVREVPVE